MSRAETAAGAGLVAAVGILGFALRFALPAPAAGAYEPPARMPRKAIYLISDLGTEATAGRDRVYQEAALTERTLYRFVRAGRSWREEVLWSTAPESQPGDFQQYRPGLIGTRRGNRVVEEPTHTIHATASPIWPHHYAQLVAGVASGAVRNAGTVACNGGRCGLLVRVETWPPDRTPYRGAWSLPLRQVNRQVTRYVYDPDAGWIRQISVVYNDRLVYKFVLRCAESGMERCKPADAAPGRAKRTQA